MVMRRLGVGVGGGPRRAPAGPSAAAPGVEENAPPGGSATASRHPIRTIQPRLALASSSRKPQWPVPAPAPSRGPGDRAAAAVKAPARPSASLAPARSLRKPTPPRLGHAAMSSAEVFPPFKAIYWEENQHNEQDALDRHCCNDDPEMEAFEFSDSEYSPTVAVQQEMICQLKSQLKQSDIKMQELMSEVSASLTSWDKEREVWEQSMADLEVDICELEKRVNIMKEEAEHQRRKQRKVEVELRNARQQLPLIHILYEKYLIKKYQAKKILRQNEEFEEMRCQLKDKTTECLKLQAEVSELKQLLSQDKASDQAGMHEVKGNAAWDGKAARRINRKWSQQEENALRKGIDKHGIGNWKLILMSDKDSFAGRTPTDLKDKWRNMQPSKERRKTMDASKARELREFVEACKKDPSLLADLNLAFFRDYLESLGAKIPAAAAAKDASFDKPKKSSMDDIDDDDGANEDLHIWDATPELDELDEEIVESDLELERDTIQSDHDDPPQKMGDPSIEVTEENRDASQEAEGKAMEAMSEGKLDDAIEHLTNAIVLNPLSANMYGTRASVFIKMKKPAAAIRDANAALEINPDSAKGYKTRGMAYAMLDKWEEAARDLHTASNMNYDEEINAALKKVELNAHKIVEHRRKYERLRKEREEKKAERDRLRQCAEAQAKRKEQSSSRSSGGASPRGFPGGMPGGGFPAGMPGGFSGAAMPGGFPGGGPGNVDMSQILNAGHAHAHRRG